MAHVTDAELEAAAQRARNHQRQSSLAKMAGMSLFFVAIGVGIAVRMVLPGELAEAIGGRLIIGAGVLGLLAGAFVNNRLEPKYDPYGDD